MNRVMKKYIITGVFLSMMALTGCYFYGPCLDGSGPVIGEVREIGDFTGVSNNGSFDVYVTRADEFYVEVVAQENLISIIETYVSGNTLNIEIKDGTCYRSSSAVEVHVSLPELEALRLSGSGEVFADVAETREFECSNSGSGRINIDEVVADAISLTNSGSGTMNLTESSAGELNVMQSGSGTIDGGTFYGTGNVKIRHSSSGRIRASIPEGTAIDVVLSGSGNVDLDGEVTSAGYTLNSSGKIDALELEAIEVEATVTGSGKIFTWATETLKATITGSGDVIYRGQPTISFQITGSGNVKPY